MNVLQERFEVQLQRIEEMIHGCLKEKDIPLCMFKKDMRTPFFMLEGLCRIYSNIHFGKPFTKWEKRTKKMEDELGMIDYALWLRDECLERKILSPEMKTYFNRMLQQSLKTLWNTSEEADWMNGKRLIKMRKKMKALQGTRSLDKEFPSYFQKQINEIIQFHEHSRYVDIENDLHEMRRKLRWLSIYAHSLQGAVVLAKESSPSSIQKKYLSKEIISSPFNQLPLNKEITPSIFFDSNSFLVLNAVISHLGSLKDEGLLIRALQTYFMEKQTLDRAKALKKSYKLLGYTSNRLQEILKEGSAYLNRFFQEKHLHQLIIKK